MAEMILSFEPFRAESILVPAPWRAWLLPLPTFPIPASTLLHDGLTPYRKLVERLRHTFITDLRLEHNVLVQAWKLSGTDAAEAMQAHQKTWPFDFALGIWPDRLPPRGGTKTPFRTLPPPSFARKSPPCPRTACCTSPVRPISVSKVPGRCLAPEPRLKSSPRPRF